MNRGLLRFTVKEGESLPIRANLKLPPSKPAAEIKQFSASPETIQAGRSTKLNWTTQDATEVSIEPDLGSVSPSGTRDVSPSKTTTYTITAKGIGGTKTSTVRVNVEQPPPVSEPPRIVSFAAADPTIQEEGKRPNSNGRRSTPRMFPSHRNRQGRGQR